MDDKRAMETTQFMAGGTSPRGMIFAFNTAHNFEHYGNLVTYMRLNKIRLALIRRRRCGLIATQVSWFLR